MKIGFILILYTRQTELVSVSNFTALHKDFYRENEILDKIFLLVGIFTKRNRWLVKTPNISKAWCYPIICLFSLDNFSIPICSLIISCHKPSRDNLSKNNLSEFNLLLILIISCNNSLYVFTISSVE